jgi:predicted kinase
LNATSISRRQREAWISLAADYGYRVEIVALETPPDRLYRQNRERTAAVPAAALDRMIRRWEAPSRIEAHALRWVSTGAEVGRGVG